MSWLSDTIGISFARPEAFWLLLAVPLVALLGWRLGTRRGRLRRSALLLRLAVLTVLVGTVAQPLLARSGAGSNTIFVVDMSRSTEEQRVAVDAWLQGALADAGPEARTTVVGFGAGSVLAVPPGEAAEVDPEWRSTVSPDAVDPTYSNAESGLGLARTLPVGGARRIVVLSDGAENIGSVMNQVSQAASDGTPVDVVPLTGIGQDDLRIDSLLAPASLWEGDTPSIGVTVASGGAGSATLELLVDGQVVASQSVTLAAGLNTFTFTAPVLPPGFHAVAVRVSGDASIDRVAENNVAPAALVVRAAPRVMIVAPTGSDPGRLQGALERRGAEVTVVAPQGVPSRLSELGAYDAFVLNNVPASAFSIDQVAGLKEATRSLGKGLIVVGGTSSYGPGNYAGSELEDALPVTVKVTDGKQRQRIALLLIVDRSGSMSYNPVGGVSKIDMAKEALRLAAGSLADGDIVGVLGFSDSQQWYVEMTTIDGQATRDRINSSIDTITANGGTEIYPALQLGFDAIRNVEADVRHVILLSDGKSQSGTPEAYQRLIAETVSDRTTVSTIAIGEDADIDLLQSMASQGGGRFQFTDKPEDIPRITLAEAQSAGSQSVIRGSFQPIQMLPSPILTGLEPETLPPLDGYDFAESKANAQVVLVSQRDDPILAKWQYGLGRVVSWTADDGADLASQWNGWADYDAFWAGMLRWSLPDPDNRPISISVEREGPEAVISIGTDTATGDYVDLTGARASITGPDGALTEDISLFQSAPGEYQIRVDAPVSGAYAISVQPADGGEPELAGFTMPASPELQPAPGGARLLESIALQTGGRVLSLDDPSGVFDVQGSGGTPLRNYVPVWPYPLVAALTFFLMELAIRFRFLARVQAGRGAA